MVAQLQLTLLEVVATTTLVEFQILATRAHPKHLCYHPIISDLVPVAQSFGDQHLTTTGYLYQFPTFLKSRESADNEQSCSTSIFFCMLTGMSLETTKRRETVSAEKKTVLTLKSTAAHRNFDDDASESIIGRVSQAI